VYHPDIIKANVERMQRRLDLRAQQARDPESEKLQLQYHSIAEVNQARQYFREREQKYKYALETDPKTPPIVWNLEEKRWIRNERIMCRLDFQYFATRYAFIRARDGQLILFSPNTAQQIVHTLRAENELEQKAIAFIQLKARQLGVSTDTELVVLHRAQFYSQTNAVVASSDPDKSTKMAGMMERAFENQPTYLCPNIRQVKGELIEFPLQRSFISIQHGTQFTGISRGDTPTVAHLSELCDFDNAEELVDASLLPAMHDSPWMFLVMESTAKGRRNWWHKAWDHAKAEWQNNRSRLRPIFLPWFVGSDMYPSPTWIHTRPVPADWQVPDRVIAHAERARNYVRSNDLLKRFLGADWQMPIEQLWFYDVTRSEYIAKNEGNKFLQEYPADDLEAFQSTAISVFDTDTISWYRDEAGRRTPLGVYTVLGDDIPDRLRVPERQWDTDKPAIIVKANWSPGTNYEYTLQPVRWQGYSSDDGLGKVYIYERPQDYEEYGFGVDTSDGLGQDRSVIFGLRKGDFHRNDFQCVEYANPYINAFDLWPICMALGSYYSVKREGMLHQPRMAIECKGNGEATQNELRKRGWTNFHKWVRYDTRRIRKAQANKLGIFTNYWFRTMMMDWIIKFLRDGWLDICSPWFVVEMEDLERGEEVQELKATYGGHDDRIMACGMVLLSLYDTEIRSGGSRSPGVARAPRPPQGEVYYPTYDEQTSWQTHDKPLVQTPMEAYLMAPNDRAWAKGDPRSYLFGGKPEPEAAFSEYDL
jgi:hypothetical protein